MRAFLKSCLLTFLILAVASGSLSASDSILTGPGYDSPDTCHFTDWFGMSDYLDHVQMANAFLMNPPPLPHNPQDQYVRAITYNPAAKLDSLGLDTFLQLSPEVQQGRAELAAKYRVRVAEFYNMIHKYLVLSQEAAIPVFDTINNRSVTDCIRALTTSTGLDPSDASAWYDLASFTAVVGDKQRSLFCLGAAWQALEQQGPGSCPDFRQRIALDTAWAYRDLGLQAESLAWVGRARGLGADSTETLVIEGLALADQGRFNDAIAIANKIGPIETRKRRIYSTLNPWAAKLFPSEYARSWVKGMAFLRTGDYDLACNMVKLANPVRVYPQAKRFWMDVGLIHELAGRPEASGFFGLAVTWSAYLLYYPIDGMRGAPRAFGQGDTGHGFFRTHQSLFMAGSLFSYAAMTAVEAKYAQDKVKSDQLASLALDAMDICRRRGIRPTASLALRGRFLFSRDDFAGAYVSLKTAILEQEERSLRDAENNLFAGLAALRIDLAQDALAYLTEAAEIDPTRAVTWNALGAARDLNDDPAGARIAFDKSIALEPESALTWYNRGLLNYNVGDVEGAVNDLQVALELDPRLQRAERLLRTVEGGEPDAAGGSTFEYEDARAADLLAAEGRQIPRVRKDMSGLEEGLVAVKSGRQPRATSRPYTAEDVEALAKAYRDDPSRANRRALAEGLIRVGNPDDARDLMLPFWSETEAVDEHTLMLEADRALGDTQRAQQLAASLGEGPPTQGNSTLWALVAFICLDAGLKDQGMAALDAAISLDPENTALKRHRSLLSSG